MLFMHMVPLRRSTFLGLGGGGGGYRHAGRGGNATSLNGLSLWASESAARHRIENGGFGGGGGGCGGGGGGGYSGEAASFPHPGHALKTAGVAALGGASVSSHWEHAAGQRGPDRALDMAAGCAAGGGGGLGGGGGGSFIHYDALDVSKDVGHEGHGCAEVVYVAPSAGSLRTQILETSKLKRAVSAPKTCFGWAGFS
jgi:hypothetical protein